MAFIPEEDNDIFSEDIDMDDEELPGESSNRTFIIAASVLGGIILLALMCVAAYALIVVPQQEEGADNANATLVARDTQVAQGLTETAEADAFAQAAASSPTAIASPTASATPVVAVATETPTQTPDIASTGTVAAALTQAGQAILTIVPTSSALPNSGFADDVGIPGLVALTTIFIAIIFFARKLRKASINS